MFFLKLSCASVAFFIFIFFIFCFFFYFVTVQDLQNDKNFMACQEMGGRDKILTVTERFCPDHGLL